MRLGGSRPILADMDLLASLGREPLTWMYAGAATQLAVTGKLRRPHTYLWLIGPFSLLIGLLVGALSYVTDPHYAGVSLQIGPGYVLMMCAAVLAGTAPARVDEETVLALTTAFWLTFADSLRASPLLLAAALVPTAFAALVAVTDFHPPLPLRVGLYAWTLIVLVALGARELPFYRDSGAIGAAALALAFYIGSHAVLLTHNVASLFFLIPVPSEDHSLKQSWKNAAEHARKLAASYSPRQIPLWRAAVVVAGQVALTALGRAYDWGDEGATQHALVWVLLTVKLYDAEDSGDETPAPLPTTGALHRERRAARLKGPKTS